jgi:hypothetical protein
LASFDTAVVLAEWRNSACSVCLISRLDNGDLLAGHPAHSPVSALIPGLAVFSLALSGHSLSIICVAPLMARQKSENML